ncbi:MULTISPECIES: hypothetical protein [unclassified Burkholderia]|uniref:hypothetical protein n=1 Tax=unclassified Burkholderia TaxID=2613784 RepID=UPI000F56AAD2|nr:MULTISPECIES: hypothetical protein [unclassified Burkholderia]
MTTQNENSPLTHNESGQEPKTVEARVLSGIDNGMPSKNLSRRESPAPEQASEAANSGAGPVREAIVDAAADVDNGTNSKLTIWMPMPAAAVGESDAHS